jgi:hypothetical protein
MILLKLSADAERLALGFLRVLVPLSRVWDKVPTITTSGVRGANAIKFL